MKLAHQRWFDAVALCVGSMMPDLMYSFSAYVGIDTHRWPAAFTYGIPLAFVVATVLRRVVAPVVPNVIPDAGEFRLRSYGVLATRRPSATNTLLSATLGIGSHITLDWFTHPGRPGVRWLGYDDIAVTVFGVTAPLADVFQLIGHSVGTLIAIWLLWLIAQRRLLEEWYGKSKVDAIRAQLPSTRDQARFWSLTIGGLVIGLAWGAWGEPMELIQRSAVGTLLGCIAGAVLVRRSDRTPLTTLLEVGR